jgi:hypothetical protein
MGLLDEAIKEHLDLKRRRGADPEDVAREEREALGPAVREVREAMGGDQTSAQGDVPAVAEVADGQAAAPAEAAEPPEEPAPAPAEAAAPAEAPEEPAPPAAAEPPGDQATQVFDADDLFAEEDDALVPDPEAPPATDQAQSSDPDEVRPDPEAPPPTQAAAAPGEEGDDVLQETPDFLQETPEHDRLWFEQRPPRDFDWDK